jgi:4-carboxymuconolactone decarboxylase
MDEAGKQTYDAVAGGPGKTVSPTGPVNVHLYSPGTAEPLRRMNEYLRRPGNPLGDPIIELAILVAAREGDSQYLWTQHEPLALKAGLSPSIIDLVKYNRNIAGAGEKEALVIDLGRQLFRSHKLDSATFAKAVAQFGKPGTVELVTLMGDYTLNGLLLAAVDQQVPPDRKPLLPPR